MSVDDIKDVEKDGGAEGSAPAEGAVTEERPAPVAAEAPAEKKRGAGSGAGGGVRITPVASPLMQSIQVPEVLPLLPVRGSVGFPGSVMPLTIGRPRSKQL